MSEFEKSMNGYGMVFGLTCSERDRLSHVKFMQKSAMLEAIGKLKPTYILRLKNIVHFNGEFHKEDVVYLIPKDIDQLASDLMEKSMSYAILWIDCDILGFNEIAIARTAHHTTNIDADIIGALIDKLGKDEMQLDG